jgi:hypothetical protein
VSNVNGLYSFQWSWQARSERPEDVITNTFHFVNTDTVSDYDNVRDILQNFYTVEAEGSVGSIVSYMSSAAITGAWTLKAYALQDPKPRQPVIMWQGQGNPAQDPPLPSEVALVQSFQADIESGEIPARRRNRVYLGPFTEGANGTGGRPTDNLVQTMLFQGKQMIAESLASVRWTWVAYSPTTDEANPITNGWVDNAWDTQRRRGLYYSQRGTYTATSPEI